MSFQNQLSLTERLQTALTQPSICQRCQEVSQLLQEVSSKDGNYVLRSVIESIFGSCDEGILSAQQQQLGGGWGLRIITLSEHRNEFETLRAFLSPNGPLLGLIYRLSNDPFQLLPFPVALLPIKVRTEIQAGNAVPFYTSKIQNLGPGKTPTNILFNAFEFYIFHFGYFLVGSRAQLWNYYWSSVRDSLFPTLLEDYLSTYLPCDAALPPGPSTAPVTPRGILSPVSQRPSGGSYFTNAGNLSLLASPIGPPFKSLDNSHLDASVMGGLGAGMHQTSSPFHPSSPHGEVNTWTSQALIQVLMEIWINVCVSPPAISTTAHHASLFVPNQAPVNTHPSLKDVFVPMGDHVRAVRMLVKHFHYFSNSLKPHHSSPLDPLRRNIWSMCRKSLYYFIKHLFLHWPLDSSFRLVLETWLSYIQPWRYLTYIPLERSVGALNLENDLTRSVDPKWKGFIAENLLFYTHLFSLLLKRILRLDLSSPKNAQILFRVAKVFSQGNLMAMIQEVEDLLEANQMQKSFLGFVGGLNAPCIPPGTQETIDGQHLPQLITQMVRSHILEVERPHYHYAPLFGEEVLKDVYRLLKLSKRAHDSLSAELAENPGAANTVKESSGWWSSLLNSLFDTPQRREDENSIEEMKKCVSHLEIAMNQFSSIFNISLHETALLSSQSDRRSLNLSFNDGVSGTPEKSRVPDQMLTSTGPTLTDYGRRQMLCGMRRLDLKYEGDPDLKPICTFEVAFLVRILHSLATFINNKYEVAFINSFYRKDFVGNIARVLLAPPQTVYEIRKGFEADDPQRRSAKDLPSRISLRFLARKKLIGFVLLVYGFFWMFKLSFGKFLQIALPFLIGFVICKAFLQQKSAPTLHIRSVNKGIAGEENRPVPRNLNVVLSDTEENRGV